MLKLTHPKMLKYVVRHRIRLCVVLIGCTQQQLNELSNKNTRSKGKFLAIRINDDGWENSKVSQFDELLNIFNNKRKIAQLIAIPARISVTGLVVQRYSCVISAASDTRPSAEILHLRTGTGTTSQVSISTNSGRASGKIMIWYRLQAATVTEFRPTRTMSME